MWDKTSEIIKQCVNVPLIAEKILGYTGDDTVPMGDVKQSFFMQLILLENIHYLITVELLTLRGKLANDRKIK